MRDPDYFLTAEGFLRWLVTRVLVVVSFAILGLTLLVSAGWTP